jgi:tripeptidyl-peptidase-1
LVAVVAAVVASPRFDDHVLFKTREFFPSTYKRVEVARDEKWLATPVSFTILLKQKNLKKLEDLFWKVSDPTHELYGQYLSAEEIHSMTEASMETREAVLTWVQSVYKTSGLKTAPFNVIDRRDALKITAPVAVVEALFKTTLAPFKRTRGYSRPSMYIKYVDTLSIPREFENVIDLVTGIVEFSPIPQTPQVGAEGLGDCNTPYTMKRMYSIDEDLDVATQGASQAPYSEVGNKGEGFGASDLKEFQDINNLHEKPITNIIGDDVVRYTDSDTDTEAALDVQCLTGFGDGANTSFWVMDDWMYEFANEILNTDEPPLVNSMSYGWYESQQCRVDGNCTEQGFGTSQDYVTRTDVEFQKLGVLGITMLAASGDDGTESNKGCTEMRPDYPASSVYVTSVGATAVVNDHMTDPPIGSDAPAACTNSKYNCQCSTSNLEHSAMKSNNAGFDSGGGFSQWLPRPAYQDTAVKAYLNGDNDLPSQQYWNSTNRGYPDVAAVGAAVLVIKNGRSIKVGGTSASCPIWGGIITLLNSDRLTSGKSPLGFMNPLLYKMYQDEPDCYNDITVGTNGGGCSNLAFHCAEGWDPLTGLGSPVFDKIRAYVAKLK